jgi:hypothetical protein
MKQSLAVVGKVNSFKFSFERIEGMHWGAFQDGKIALMVQTSALNVDNLGVPGEIQNPSQIKGYSRLEKKTIRYP